MQTNVEVNPDAPAGGVAEESVDRVTLDFSPTQDAEPSDDHLDALLGIDQGLVDPQNIQPQPDPQAEIEAERQRIAAEREALRQEKERIAAEQAVIRQRAMREEAQRQWDEAERQALEHAKTLEYDEAIQFMANFGRMRSEAFRQIAEQTQMMAFANQYKVEVIEKYGLTPDEAAMLGDDPNKYEAMAHAIARQKQAFQAQIDELNRKVHQTNLGQRSLERRATGVDIPGGINGQPVAPDLERVPLRQITRAIFYS